MNLDLLERLERIEAKLDVALVLLGDDEATAREVELLIESTLGCGVDPFAKGVQR